MQELRGGEEEEEGAQLVSWWYRIISAAITRNEMIIVMISKDPSFVLLARYTTSSSPNTSARICSVSVTLYLSRVAERRYSIYLFSIYLLGFLFSTQLLVFRSELWQQEYSQQFILPYTVSVCTVVGVSTWLYCTTMQSSSHRVMIWREVSTIRQTDTGFCSMYRWSCDGVSQYLKKSFEEKEHSSPSWTLIQVDILR